MASFIRGSIKKIVSMVIIVDKKSRLPIVFQHNNSGHGPSQTIAINNLNKVISRLPRHLQIIRVSGMVITRIRLMEIRSVVPVVIVTQIPIKINKEVGY